MKRLSKSLVVGSLVAMFIPALSAPASAENIQSLPETTCKEVLANWGLITIEQGGSITKDEALDSMDQSGSINVTTINQLYCIGAGAYAVDENNNLTQTGSNCNDGESILAELMHMKYTQVQDLDFKDLTVDGATQWRPIGNNGCQFMGVYDGNSKSISNLYFNQPDLGPDSRPFEGIGLFGSTGINGNKLTGTNAVIKNLTLNDVAITGQQNVGALIGIADKNTQISNVHVNGIVRSKTMNGSDSTYPGSNNYVRLGGIVGWANGETSDHVTISSSNFAGSLGTVGDGEHPVWGAGGLIGAANETEITTSHARVTLVTSKISYVGGLAGSFYNGSISKSWASGYLEVRSESGGLIGDGFSSTVENSYSTTSVISNAFPVIGGITGYGDGVSITNSFAAGHLSSPDSNPGGLVGARYDHDNPIVNSYWDSETTGTSKTEPSEDANTAPSVRGTPRNSYEMRNAGTFAWNIASSSVWGIDSTKNSGYPYLKDAVAPPTCINVLQDWGMISFDSEVPTMNVNIDPSQTYDVSTINQLYCIGQGSFGDDGLGFADWTQRSCSHESAIYSNLMFASYRQTADLDFNELTVDNATDWRPIGNNRCQFMGEYDGDGFEIRDLTYSRSNVGPDVTIHEGVGLFGSTGVNGHGLANTDRTSAVIKNVVLQNVDFAGYQDVGGIVGVADSQTQLVNVSVSGHLSISNAGWGDLGGLIGWVDGNTETIDGEVLPTVRIERSASDVTLSVTDNLGNGEATTCAGGIVGYADNLTVSYSTTAVSANTQLLRSIGGIGGCLQASIVEDSRSSANITADYSIGGLIGWASSTNYNRETFTPTIVHRSSAEVVLNGTGNKIGGLVGGYESLVVEDSYAIGTITGNSSVGGLVGGFENSNRRNKERDGLNVSRSYASVVVPGTNSGLGGFVGHLGRNETLEDSEDQFLENFEPLKFITNSFWDTDVSGYSATAGDHGTGKTTAELKTLSTFTGAGWDIAEGIDTTKVWGIATDRNSGYPFLQERPSSPSDPGNSDGNQNPDTGGGNTNNTPATNQTPSIKEQIQNRKLMEAITPAAFSQITPEQLATLPISSIRGITKQHAEVMTLAQLRALTPSQIRVLRPSTLAALPAEWLSKLSAEQIKFLLPRQIRALSQKQIEKFTAKQRSVIASVLRKATKQSNR